MNTNYLLCEAELKEFFRRTPTLTTTYLKYVKGETKKFWSVVYDSKATGTTKATFFWGRLGTKPSTTIKSLTVDQITSLINSKIKKGYKQIPLAIGLLEQDIYTATPLMIKLVRQYYGRKVTGYGKDYITFEVLPMPKDEDGENAIGWYEGDNEATLEFGPERDEEWHTTIIPFFFIHYPDLGWDEELEGQPIGNMIWNIIPPLIVKALKPLGYKRSGYYMIKEIEGYTFKLDLADTGGDNDSGAFAFKIPQELR